MATARVLLFKGGAGAGPRVERSEPKQGVVWRSTSKGTYTRRYIHKAVHTHGGPWPPLESCYFKGVQVLAPVSSEASRSKG